MSSDFVMITDAVSKVEKKYVPEEWALAEISSLKAMLEFLLENVVKCEEGVFTFPDGTSMPCGKKVGYVYTKVGD